MTQTAITEQSNPATSTEARRTRPPRVPMSTPRQRLQTMDIPGWHLHWFKEDNVPAALEAYYELVARGEISLNPQNVGIGKLADGNTDMGTNVSIIAGQNAAGQPVRLILMKVKEEYWKEDQLELEKRNVQIMQAIFGDEAQVGMGGAVKELDPLTYIGAKTKISLYNRKIRKAKIVRRK